MISVRRTRLLVSLLILIVLIFAGCQRIGQAPSADGTGENADIQIALHPMPLEEILAVVLTDADGAPITDATVALEGNMNHAGMIPVLANPVADDADGDADGHYHLPFTFTMFGDWIVSVTVNLADGSSFTRNLDVQANSDGIAGESVMPMDEDAESHADHADHDEMADMPEEASDDMDTEMDADMTEDEAAHDHADHEHSDHADPTGVHAAVMHIHDPMARPAPLVGGTGAVYFLLHNGGDTPVTLLGGDSSASAAVEIHTTINDEGVMKMRQLTDGVDLGPDESIQLVPGGMHIMLVDLAAPLAEGDTFTLTLHFDGADDFTLDVPVVSMDMLPAEGEMEMDHSH